MGARSISRGMDSTATVKPRHPEKAHRPDNPVRVGKPEWIRVKAPVSPEYAETKRIVRERGLVTVCEEAACPNIGECWKKKHATMMILGAVCTRACSFCNVATGMPDKLDPHEPEKVADAAAACRAPTESSASGGTCHATQGGPPSTATATVRASPSSVKRTSEPRWMAPCGSVRTATLPARP